MLALGLLATGLSVIGPIMPTAHAEDSALVRLEQAFGDEQGTLPRPGVGIGAAARPDLPFYLAVTWHCPLDTQPAGLLISIADTAHFEASPPPSPRTLRVDVPLAQLDWFSQPAQNCHSAGSQREPDEVDDAGLYHYRLPAGTAAYATLTCRKPDGQTVGTTTTAPLAVWLRCEKPVE